MPSLPTLLDTDEAAKLIGVSKATLRRWAREGKIDAIVLPSGRRRFDKTAILRALSKQGGWAA